MCDFRTRRCSISKRQRKIEVKRAHKNPGKKTEYILIRGDSGATEAGPGLKSLHARTWFAIGGLEPLTQMVLSYRFLSGFFF